jgi:hypothetical protein
LPFKCDLQRYTAVGKKRRRGEGEDAAGAAVGLCTLNLVDP